MKFLMLLIGVLLLVFFGLPDSVLYAKDGLGRWFPFFLLFFLVPFLLYKTLKEYKIHKSLALGLSIGSVLLFGPLFGFWVRNLSNRELEKNGVIQKGVVIQKWHAKKRGSADGEWLYRASFNVKNAIFYTFSHEDVRNALQVGDTILIKYSKNNPENNEIWEGVKNR